MNKLSKPTIDSLVPLPIVELKPTRRLNSGFQTLTDLMHAADGITVGRITRNHLFRIERGSDSENYYTTISLEGKSLWPLEADLPCLLDSACLDITFRGGSIQTNRGTYDSDAPFTDEVEVGQQVLVFHRWMSDLGAGIRGNGLVGLRAGLFPVCKKQGQTWIRGRGPGFGIALDLPLAELSTRIELIERHRHGKSHLA